MPTYMFKDRRDIVLQRLLDEPGSSSGYMLISHLYAHPVQWPTNVHCIPRLPPMPKVWSPRIQTI
jgi:hypothetical protein